MFTKDQQGLYYDGEIVAYSYSDAIKELFQINEIPTGFTVNTDHEAFGYSVVNANGVQHIYELNPVAFYDAFMNLE